ncbi:hypothetical protein TCON_1052 [Astathelohania contejeani]|uniref:Uncharacterized protein n=1 Tax=Astathelohania contejeani TaxID=164912 RepID=A0ABQ7HZY8_9MICR|nr:hypothetical protein TCON_1052 [Thelohania contejeani]
MLILTYILFILSSEIVDDDIKLINFNKDVFGFPIFTIKINTDAKIILKKDNEYNAYMYDVAYEIEKVEDGIINLHMCFILKFDGMNIGDMDPNILIFKLGYQLQSGETNISNPILLYKNDDKNFYIIQARESDMVLKNLIFPTIYTFKTMTFEKSFEELGSKFKNIEKEVENAISISFIFLQNLVEEIYGSTRNTETSEIVIKLKNIIDSNSIIKEKLNSVAAATNELSLPNSIHNLELKNTIENLEKMKNLIICNFIRLYNRFEKIENIIQNEDRDIYLLHHNFIAVVKLLSLMKYYVDMIIENNAPQLHNCYMHFEQAIDICKGVEIWFKV